MRLGTRACWLCAAPLPPVPPPPTPCTGWPRPRRASLLRTHPREALGVQPLHQAGWAIDPRPIAVGEGRPVVGLAPVHLLRLAALSPRGSLVNADTCHGDPSEYDRCRPVLRDSAREAEGGRA